jgi:hypothetical protein
VYRPVKTERGEACPRRLLSPTLATGMKTLCVLLLAWLASLALTLAAETNQGRFEALGIPVRVNGLKGCVVGPDRRNGETLYFNFNQIDGNLFLIQVNPDTGEAKQFNSPTGPEA